jgi:hypothetical protein
MSSGQTGRARMIDLAGQRFGKWLVTGESKSPKTSTSARWCVTCDCGAAEERYSRDLRVGKSTGCLSCVWANADRKCGT